MRIEATERAALLCTLTSTHYHATRYSDNTRYVSCAPFLYHPKTSPHFHSYRATDALCRCPRSGYKKAVSFCVGGPAVLAGCAPNEIMRRRAHAARVRTRVHARVHRGMLLGVGRSRTGIWKRTEEHLYPSSILRLLLRHGGRTHLTGNLILHPHMPHFTNTLPHAHSKPHHCLSPSLSHLFPPTIISVKQQIKHRCVCSLCSRSSRHCSMAR